MCGVSRAAAGRPSNRTRARSSGGTAAAAAAVRRGRPVLVREELELIDAIARAPDTILSALGIVVAVREPAEEAEYGPAEPL